VTDVQLNLQSNGTLNLVFQEHSAEGGNNRSCQLGLQASLLHGLLHLLDQALQQAHWQLEIPAARPEGDVFATPAHHRSSYTH